MNKKKDIIFFVLSFIIGVLMGSTISLKLSLILLIPVVILLYVLIYKPNNLFKIKTDKEIISEFVSTERYKNSNYILQKVNDEYGLKNKISGKYVDLVTFGHNWHYGDTFTTHCFSSNINKVIKMFDLKCPKIESLNIQEEY